MLVVFALSSTGCCGPYIGSQRGADFLPAAGRVPHVASDCEADCGCGQGFPDGERRRGLPSRILHAVAGPFTPHAIADPYQSAAHPPHSKFHPVPTRPVFAPLHEPSPLAPNEAAYMAPGLPSLVVPSLAPAGDEMPAGPGGRQPGDAAEESHPLPRLLPAPRPAEL